MELQWNSGRLRVRDVDFDPELVLMDSAQVFHWRMDGEGFYATVAGHPVRLAPETGGFTLLNAREEDVSFWRRYFDLDRDYRAVAERCARYPAAARAMELLPGMRVLNQPAWEALIAFILSANNNAPRIRSLVLALIDCFGEAGGFPTPARLAEAGEEALRKIRCGYRAPYLVDTAVRVRDGFDLEGLGKLSYQAAHERLVTLAGVGDKVADCVQLFGLGQSEAFPVDVWVERLMKNWFAPELRSKGEARRLAWEMFGPDAGLVQQSLFHCARLGLMEV